MATIDDLYEAISALDLRGQLPVIIEATSNSITDKIKTQLAEGELPTGNKIPIEYASKYYAKKKVVLNPVPGYGIPDIKLTGDLYAGLNVKANQETYEITSSVDYAQSKSITQYGEDLFNLSEESKQEYCDNALLPAIQTYISEKTGLLFE